MKFFIATTFLSLFFVGLVNSQEDYEFEILDINSVSAPIYAGGPFYVDPGNYNAGYNVNNDEAEVIYQSSIWIGGLNDDGGLHVSAETFKQACNPENGECDNTYADFWSGPNADIYDAEYDSKYYKVWRISRSDITYHIAHYNDLDYIMPDDFLTWPGNGDVSTGEPQQLALYNDMNENGIYEPENGDTPQIKGDQVIYTILSDGRMENSSGGDPIMVDIHYMIYAFNCVDNTLPEVNETTFTNMRIVNRSENNYHDLYVGTWTDFDIGNATDDFIGTDIELNLQYAYNGDGYDEISSTGGFHETPPACGIIYLNNDLTTSMFYMNGGNEITGEPTEPIHYYNYLRSFWKDGSPLLDESGNSTNHLFTDSPTNENGWSMLTNGDNPSDMRGLSSVGNLTLNTGEEIEIDFAYIYARGESGGVPFNHIENVDLLIETAQIIQNYYDGAVSCSTVDIDEEGLLSFYVYPNPSSGVLNIESGIMGRLEIFNIVGEMIFEGDKLGERLTIDVSGFTDGLYFVRVGDKVQRFVKE